jgi:hypothetical protein
MRFIVQARQRELQPDGEHQEHHAELGQVARLIGIGHPGRAACGPMHGADQQVAQDRRQPSMRNMTTTTTAAASSTQDQRQCRHPAVIGEGGAEGRVGGCYNLAPS